MKTEPCENCGHPLYVRGQPPYVDGKYQTEAHEYPERSSISLWHNPDRCARRKREKQ